MHVYICVFKARNNHESETDSGCGGKEHNFQMCLPVVLVRTVLSQRMA